VITLRMPASAAEHVRFELSPLAELVHSWHALTAPEHHALQLPWVRRCGDLPAGLRADLREWSWVVRDQVPALFEAGAGGLTPSFANELDQVAALPVERVVEDLTKAIPPDADPAGERLARVRAEPAAVLNELLEVIERYWRVAFAEEWRRLEQRMLDAVAEAGASMPAGVLPLLSALVPAARVDQRSRTVALDHPHSHRVHRVNVAERGPLHLTPSFFAWPHVRVTCDEPWPLRLTYPVVPPSPGGRRTRPADVLGRLRALAAQPRLDILKLLRERPRSTQELSGLLGMSGAATSRHLRQLLDADLVRTQRQGYYVLYRVAPRTLDELAAQLVTLG
jgi:DNA-binding transcriptional ArsR family regulator